MSRPPYILKGKQIMIASKHQKERALASVFETIGVEVIPYRDFDTDTLGTFSGEVARELTPFKAAREKCDQVHQMTGAELVMANEGSFGPHAEMPFVPGDEELLLLVDYKGNRSFTSRVMSFETNFNAKDIKSNDELKQFLDDCLFPSHAVILRPSKDEYRDICMGCQDSHMVWGHFDFLMSKYGKAYVETDMRAMYNPSRMKVIAQAAEELTQIIKTPCPSCAAAGFRKVGSQSGLPCSWCGQPTQSIASVEWKCDSCGFSEWKNRPDKSEEDPMYCQHCNP